MSVILYFIVRRQKRAAHHPKRGVRILKGVGFMCDKKHCGPAIGRVPQKTENGFCVFIVQIAGRLIRQDCIRPLHQAPRDGHAAQFAAGQFARHRVAQIPNAQAIQEQFRPLDRAMLSIRRFLPPVNP